jgi:predicted dehydrogenase
MPTILRLALLGCGEHSKGSHAAPMARYAAEHPKEIELVAACDLNLARANEFCQEFGFARAYNDAETMLNTEQVDGCVCVMPMEQIVKSGVMLLERGVPCVIEKPLGISAVEAERLARVAGETRTPHMVSVNRRFMTYMNQAISWARAVGPLQYIRATQVRHNRAEPDFIWSTAIHVLDALRYIGGEVADFSTETRNQPGLSAQWYVITLRFESGTTGRIEVLPTAGMVEESYELFGEGFRVRLVAGSGIQRSLQCWRGGQLEVNEQASSGEPEELHNGGYEEVVEFVRALRAGRQPNPSVEDILPSARICFAIAESFAHQTEAKA